MRNQRSPPTVSHLPAPSVPRPQTTHGMPPIPEAHPLQPHGSSGLSLFLPSPFWLCEPLSAPQSPEGSDPGDTGKEASPDPAGARGSALPGLPSVVEGEACSVGQGQGPSHRTVSCLLLRQACCSSLHCTRRKVGLCDKGVLTDGSLELGYFEPTRQPHLTGATAATNSLGG